MVEKFLWEAGSSVVAILGVLHLYYTFFSNKFFPRNERLIDDMKSVSPVLTDEMSIWKGWISFNATHSSGAIFFGVLNFYLAFRYFEMLKTDHFFFLFSILCVGYYIWLAKKYWFKTIFIYVLLAFTCFVASYILVLIRA